MSWKRFNVGCIEVLESYEAKKCDVSSDSSQGIPERTLCEVRKASLNFSGDSSMLETQKNLRNTKKCYGNLKGYVGGGPKEIKKYDEQHIIEFNKELPFKNE